MSCLHPFVAILPLLVTSGPSAAPPVVGDAQPRQFVTIERPGGAPVVLLGSEEIFARDDLKGTWQVTHVEHEGQPRPDLAPGLQMEFTRGRLELMQQGHAPLIVAYHLDVDQNPPHFTWVFHGQFGGIQLQKGVYWAEGDTLMLCLAPIDARRATEFLTQPGDGRTLFSLERIAAEDEAGALPTGRPKSLGVFGLIKPGQPAASVLVRLAVNREGVVTGASYDLRAGSRQTLLGSIDRKASRIFWTAGADPTTVMEAELDGLGQENTQVVVRHPDGRSETWTVTLVFGPFVN